MRRPITKTERIERDLHHVHLRNLGGQRIAVGLLHGNDRTRHDFDRERNQPDRQCSSVCRATLSVSGSLSVTLYKLTVTASVTLLGLNTTDGDGVTGAISYTITSTSPVTLKFTFSLYAYLRISTLSGSIVLDLEQLSIDYCSSRYLDTRSTTRAEPATRRSRKSRCLATADIPTTQSLLDRISTSASLTL